MILLQIRKLNRTKIRTTKTTILVRETPVRTQEQIPVQTAVLEVQVREVPEAAALAQTVVQEVEAPAAEAAREAAVLVPEVTPALLEVTAVLETPAQVLKI